MWPFARSRRPPRRAGRPLDRRDPPARSLLLIGIGGGAVAFGLGISCFYAALRAAPIQQVMPIAVTSPLFGVAAAMLIGGEKLTPRDLCGMALSLAGVAILGSR